MKTYLRIAITLIICVSLSAFSVCAHAISTPTPPPKGTAAVETIQDVLDNWMMHYASSADWAVLKKLDESSDLSSQVLVRLCATYVMDAYPKLSMQQLADLEPRLEMEASENHKLLILLAMTNDGDIFLKVDCTSGILIEAQTSNPGGNG